MYYARVLLVDDEAPFVQALSRRLIKRELDVIAVFNGSEALKYLSEDAHVDVVILDVNMPGMDGIRTLREIKDAYPLVEVIMLTAHGAVESAIEGMKLGAFDYLLKPCAMDVLLTKVLEAKAKKNKHEEKIIQARMREIGMKRDN
jgi:DNA-binding NtrC family response regulator